MELVAQCEYLVDNAEIGFFFQRLNIGLDSEYVLGYRAHMLGIGQRLFEPSELVAYSRDLRRTAALRSDRGERAELCYLIAYLRELVGKRSGIALRARERVAYGLKRVLVERRRLRPFGIGCYLLFKPAYLVDERGVRRIAVLRYRRRGCERHFAYRLAQFVEACRNYLGVLLAQFCVLLAELGELSAKLGYLVGDGKIAYSRFYLVYFRMEYIELFRDRAAVGNNAFLEVGLLAVETHGVDDVAELVDLVGEHAEIDCGGVERDIVYRLLDLRKVGRVDGARFGLFERGLFSLGG